MASLKHSFLLLIISLLVSCTGTSNSNSNSTNTSNNTNNNPVNTETPNSNPTTENPTDPTPSPSEEPKTFFRPNIYTWASNGPEMTAYKKGIAAMKARPADDPTSWSYQAAIHGSIKSPEKKAWNQCQHQSFFFYHGIECICIILKEF